MVDEGSQTNRGEVFRGFSSPSFTQTPNIFFDDLMPDLGEAELKVLLYIIRRTWGFSDKQEGDTIALSQLCNGIVTSDGKRLDRGTGLSKSGATKALLSLRTKGIITRIKNRDRLRGDTATTYRLRMLGDPLDAEDEIPEALIRPLSTLVDTPVHAGRHPLSSGDDTRVHPETLPLSTLVDTQKKDIQKKESGNKDFEISKEPTPIFNEERDAISTVMRDFSRELGDLAPVPATVSRAFNIYRDSGVDLDRFLDTLYEARRITQENTGSIRTESPTKLGPKPKVAYFFGVVKDQLGMKKNAGN